MLEWLMILLALPCPPCFWPSCWWCWRGPVCIQLSVCIQTSDACMIGVHTRRRTDVHADVHTSWPYAVQVGRGGAAKSVARARPALHALGQQQDCALLESRVCLAFSGACNGVARSTRRGVGVGRIGQRAPRHGVGGIRGRRAGGAAWGGVGIR